MAGLLPSTPDTSAAEEPSPRVIGMDSEGADEMIAALSSGTARRILSRLHDEPATPSAVAEHVDTSLQNAQYHLNKLREAGLIEEIDTIYSEKGREMSVFAPTDRPLVVVAGREEHTRGLKSVLGRVLGAVALLGLASVVVEELVGRGVLGYLGGGDADAAPTGGGDGGGPSIAMDGADAAREASEPIDTALGLPPGVLFFAGGLFVLGCVVAYRYYRSAR